MEELVIANGYLYVVGLEEVQHQHLILHQFHVMERHVMCGDDKEAPSRFESQWLSGLGCSFGDSFGLMRVEPPKLALHGWQ